MPHKVCDSPDHAAHYHSLSIEARALALTSHLAGLGVKDSNFCDVTSCSSSIGTGKIGEGNKKYLRVLGFVKVFYYKKVKNIKQATT
jgi:hypothetical protein